MKKLRRLGQLPLEHQVELIADEADRLQRIRDEAAGEGLALQLQAEEEGLITRRVRRKKKTRARKGKKERCRSSTKNNLHSFSKRRTSRIWRC